MPAEPRRHLQPGNGIHWPHELIYQKLFHTAVPYVYVRGYKSNTEIFKFWLNLLLSSRGLCMAIDSLACYQGSCARAFRQIYFKTETFCILITIKIDRFIIQLLFGIDFTCPALKRWRPPAASSGRKTSLFVISRETSPCRPPTYGSTYD